MDISTTSNNLCTRFSFRTTPTMSLNMNINFRKANRTDIPNIVRLLADDTIGMTREKYVEPLPCNTMQHLMRLIQIKIII